MNSIVLFPFYVASRRTSDVYLLELLYKIGVYTGFGGWDGGALLGLGVEAVYSVCFENLNKNVQLKNKTKKKQTFYQQPFTGANGCTA